MALTIRPATKFKQYARLCFWGIPKSGKTHAALAIASAIVGPEGKVGVISSEYGSSNLLSKKFPHDIIDLTTDEHGNPIANAFAPARYEEAIKLFVDNGYQAIVIDSLSHAWEGEGGVLEKVNEKKNTFSDGWGQVGTPMYQHLIKTILSTKAHIFITIRAKDGYVLEPNKEGKMVPRNVGLKPVIRSSFGYEMQLTIRMDALVGYIDESAFQDEFPQGTQIVRPGEDVAYTLLQCLDGVPAVEPTAESAEMRRLLDELYALAPHVYAKYAQWEEMALRAAFNIKEGPLPMDYTNEHIELMRAYLESKKKPIRRTGRQTQGSDASSVDDQRQLNNDAGTTAPTETQVRSQGTVPTQTETSPSTGTVKPETPSTSQVQPEGKTGSQMDQEIRDKLNDLYTRAKKLKLCANDRQFISYVRRVVDNPRLDIKFVTLATLAKVEDDIITKEMAQELEQKETALA